MILCWQFFFHLQYLKDVTPLAVIFDILKNIDLWKCLITKMSRKGTLRNIGLATTIGLREHSQKRNKEFGSSPFLPQEVQTSWERVWLGIARWWRSSLWQRGMKLDCRKLPSGVSEKLAGEWAPRRPAAIPEEGEKITLELRKEALFCTISSSVPPTLSDEQA